MTEHATEIAIIGLGLVTANDRGMRHEATGVQEPTIRARIYHPFSTGGNVDWATDHLVTPEERQDDAWVAEIDAANAKAAAGRQRIIDQASDER